jgi:NAD(P)-dependent dehydrogenase (short-subunit alcohol dehydrogenase family)
VSSLDGKVAIVTGAAEGIGATYAGHLASLGAAVYLADIAEQEAKETAARLQSDGADAIGVRVDITDPDSCAALADQVVAERGQIDILVNNAAFYRGLEMETAEDIPLEVWRRMIDVNISGTYYMCRAVIPQMRRQGSGKIVNQSSIATWMHAPLVLHYSVSKAAAVTMTQCLAAELGEDNINVNAIAPGLINTPATMEGISENLRDMYLMLAKIQRIGTPEDLLGALELLVTPAGDYMTGQVLVVDGGICMVS